MGDPLDPKETQLFSSGQREGAFFSISSPFSPASCAPSAPRYFRLNQALRPVLGFELGVSFLLSALLFVSNSTSPLSLSFITRESQVIFPVPRKRENFENDSSRCIYVQRRIKRINFWINFYFLLISKELNREIFRAVSTYKKKTYPRLD